MPDETDSKKISTASTWRTGGDHQDAIVLSGLRVKTFQLDPNESIDVVIISHPLWRLMSTFGATHPSSVFACRKRRRKLHLHRQRL